jgi:hypothetical protein
MGALGPIEALFLLAPLVVVPLAFRLLARRGEVTPAGRAAGALRPWAAAGVVASFLMGHRGATAAVLAAPWLLVTLLAALDGAGRAGREARRPRGTRRMSALSAAAGCMMLPIGGGWLVLSRLGASPLGFEEPLPLLTAVHFHYAAFATLVLVAEAGRVLGEGPAYRAIAAGAIAGPPLLAAGITLSPSLEIVAACLLVLALSGFSVLVLGRAVPHQHGWARLLLLISSASVLGAMALAFAYAVGEFTGIGIISLARMARIHGPLNALGFVLAGLAGWASAGAQPSASVPVGMDRRPR